MWAESVRDANDVAVGNPDKSELPTEFSNRFLANPAYLTLAAFSVFVNSESLAKRENASKQEDVTNLPR
jgi:hypothetical protein